MIIKLRIPLYVVLHDMTINIDINDILIAQYDFISTTILSSYYSSR